MMTSAPQMVVLFIVYGAVFYVMAGALYFGIEKTARLGIALQLNILIVFAVVHGTSDLVDAALRIPGVPTSPVGPVAGVRLVLLVLSFLALLWFGVSILIKDKKTLNAMLLLGFVATIGLASALVALFAEGVSIGSVQNAEKAARLFLGLPGGLLSAVGFANVARRCAVLGMRGCAQGAAIAGFGMAAYAILAGAIATGYPDAVLVMGLPVQVHRMAAAIVVTAGCVIMLRGLVMTTDDAGRAS